jgi:hypothetical protein
VLEMPAATSPSPPLIQGAVEASKRIAVTHVVEQVRFSKALSLMLIDRPLRKSYSMFIN